MSIFAHVYDTESRADVVVSLDQLLSLTSQHGTPDDVVHALIDAGQTERVAEHDVCRGTLRLTNWNAAADPEGPFTPNVWHPIGITSPNLFNRGKHDGWSRVSQRASSWVCKRPGWYDIDGWFRASISILAVPVCLITRAALAIRITRAATSPAWLYDLTSLEGDNPDNRVIILGDCFASRTFIAGPPAASAPAHLQWFGASGGEAYPLWPGDRVELVWQFTGVGIDVLEVFQARISINRTESIMTTPTCCG